MRAIVETDLSKSHHTSEMAAQENNNLVLNMCSATTPPQSELTCSASEAGEKNLGESRN
jgi:hypothetical protein